MPNPTSKPSSKRPVEESKKRLSTQKSTTAPSLRRFKTEPSSELRSLDRFQAVAAPPKLTKLLLKVTIQGSVGAVQVVVSPESTVEDLIGASMKQYEKEGRRPALPLSGGFDLHYSQFSLERLERREKLANLGSRNFFLCKKGGGEGDGDGDGDGDGGMLKSCSEEAEQGTAKVVGLPWLKFLNL